jgi:hypothetical protein
MLVVIVLLNGAVVTVCLTCLDPACFLTALSLFCGGYIGIRFAFAAVFVCDRVLVEAMDHCQVSRKRHALVVCALGAGLGALWVVV